MEEGNEIQRAEKIKITLTPQRTQSQAGGGNRLHRPSQTQKCFELLTTNNMKLIQQIHNTWVPDATPGSCMSLHKKQGWGGRMNFTERARVFHVFSTPDVTFRRRSEDFLATTYSKMLSLWICFNSSVLLSEKQKESLKKVVYYLVLRASSETFFNSWVSRCKCR